MNYSLSASPLPSDSLYRCVLYGHVSPLSAVLKVTSLCVVWARWVSTDPSLTLYHPTLYTGTLTRVTLSDQKMDGKGRGKRFTSPKENANKTRIVKTAQRARPSVWKNFSSGKGPLFPEQTHPFFMSPNTNSTTTTSNTNYTYHPVSSQSEMSSWCKNALQDPNVKVLVQTLFEEPCKQIRHNSKRINTLEERFEKQEAEIQTLKQEKLSASLRIYNPEWSDNDSNENVYQLIEDFICDDLNLSEFDKGLITQARRVGRKNPDGTPRPIVCFFLTDRVCQKVYAKRTSLPEGCTMNENLIGPIANLAYCARQLKRRKDISETWVRHGKIYVKAHGEDRAHIVQTPIELLSLVQPPVLNESLTWQFAKDNYDDMDPMKYIDMIRSGPGPVNMRNSGNKDTYKFTATGNKHIPQRSRTSTEPQFQVSLAGLAEALKNPPPVTTTSAVPSAPPAVVSTAPSAAVVSAATLAISVASAASDTANAASGTESASCSSVAPAGLSDSGHKKKGQTSRKARASTDTTNACPTPIVSAGRFGPLMTIEDGSGTDGSDTDVEMLLGRLNSLRDAS